MSRKEEALVKILESIALEQEAFASLIHAERELVRLFLQIAPHLNPMLTADNLIEFNNSVNRLLLTLPTIELILQNKLDVASVALKRYQQGQIEDNLDETDEE